MRSLLILLIMAGPAFSAERDPLLKVPDEVKARVLETSRMLFIEVGVLYKAFDPAEGLEDDNPYYRFGAGSDARDKAKNRQRERFYGVQVGADGTFVADAIDFDWRHVESVMAVSADGKEHAAQPIGIARHGRLVWFRAPGLARGSDFPKAVGTPVRVGDEITEASVSDTEGIGEITVNPTLLEVTQWLDPGRLQAVLPWHPWQSIEALFDKEGNWLGVSPLHRQLNDDGSWRVDPSELAADRMDWDRYLATAEKGAESLEKTLPVVQLRFRVESDAPSPGDAAYLDDQDRKKSIKDRSDVGLPVGRELVLVPSDLDKDLVRRLESVTLVRDGKSVPARFVGVLREIEGYLVAPKDPAFLPKPAAAAEPPPDRELFLVFSPRYFGGHAAVRPHPEFFSGRERGYQDALTRATGVNRAAPALLSTLEGRPFGVMLHQRRFEAEPEAQSWNEPRKVRRFYPEAELAAYLKDTAAVIDPLVQPQGLKLTKRKPWLGVETQGMTPDLARELGVERPTQDGTRGQLVTLVYPGSPAERLGLAPGDLVLRIRDLKKKDDMPIASDYETAENDSDGRWWRSWFIRKTPLTEALGRLGVGARIQLTYAHAGREKTAELVLEEGPPDFEASPKAKIPRTGLTAKEISYDVRQILRLKDVKGVLIYDVDSGSPADVAEIDAMDIVTEVAGTPVTDLASFKAAMSREMGKGADTIRLRLRYLNDTRFADLKVAATDEPSLTSTQNTTIRP